MIKIIACGKVKEKWMKDGIAEYVKRIRPYDKIDVIEVQDEKAIQDCYNHARSKITFVIGGSLGLSNELIQRADFRWRISKATFPHQLCRILVVEQIYRSFRILHNEPYHK